MSQTWHCLNCTAANGTLTWFLNTGPWSPTACPNGMTCNWNPGTSCWSTDCYAVLYFNAASTMTPQTVVLQVDFTSQGGGSENSYDIVTINPIEVLDTDITSGSQIVSGDYGTLTIAPVFTGEQVNLDAVSAYGDQVSNVQWTFDQTGPTSVVSNYGLTDQNNGTAVGTPAPIQPSANPTSVYWLRAGTQHVHVTGVIGGNTYATDVYYPMQGPTTVTATANVTGTVWVDASYAAPPVGSFTATCGQNLITALALGDPCGPIGIVLNPFTVTVPSSQGGELQLAQVGVVSKSGTLSNGHSASANTGAPRLDFSFPYENATAWEPDSLTGPVDSPASDLTDSTCSKVSRTDSFTDYFMFKPNSPAGRPAIWIPLATENWGWSGTATFQKNTWRLSNSTNPSPTSNYGYGQWPKWPDGTIQSVSLVC